MSWSLICLVNLLCFTVNSSEKITSNPVTVMDAPFDLNPTVTYSQPKMSPSSSKSAMWSAGLLGTGAQRASPKVCFYVISPSLTRRWVFALKARKARIPYTCSGSVPKLPLNFKVCLTFFKMIKDVRQGKTTQSTKQVEKQT